MRKAKKLSVLSYARSCRFLGVNFFWLGIVIAVVRERRTIELLHSIWCEIRYLTRPVAFPGAVTGRHDFSSVYTRFTVGGDTLVAREQSIVRHPDLVVAGEYGGPGARVLVGSRGKVRIFSPYDNDRLVWHIHAICHVCGDTYLVTTGDSRKYADLVIINAQECRISKRLFGRIGGFTAVVHVNGTLWGGSDLSERVNYVRNLSTNDMYFLPERGFGTYVIGLERSDGALLVATKKLGSSDGYIFVFSLEQLKFTAGNKMTVHEKVVDDAIFA